MRIYLQFFPGRLWQGLSGLAGREGATPSGKGHRGQPKAVKGTAAHPPHNPGEAGESPALPLLAQREAHRHVAPKPQGPKGPAAPREAAAEGRGPWLGGPLMSPSVTQGESQSPPHGAGGPVLSPGPGSCSLPVPAARFLWLLDQAGQDPSSGPPLSLSCAAHTLTPFQIHTQMHLQPF